ncbi:MAG: hypothetical protein QG567_1496 [Campylobacterota bacterium]|nr:hypothetical protein [Campylobacterota bacterium]MDQ1340339.1 hypothetical protein [Campylobacterota bacterium]
MEKYSVEDIIIRLISHFGLKNMSELAEKLNVSQSVMSNWKSRNAIGAICEKVLEINPKALSSILEDVNTNIQHVRTNNGNNALNNFDKQSISGNVSKEFDEDIQDILKKAQACINESNKESFIKHVKSWIVDNL